jgi:hypothetical protein
MAGGQGRLYTVHCIQGWLYTVHCKQGRWPGQALYCTYTVYRAGSILYIHCIQGRLYTVHYIQSRLYTIHCIQGRLYTVHCIQGRLYTVHCIQTYLVGGYPTEAVGGGLDRFPAPAYLWTIGLRTWGKGQNPSKSDVGPLDGSSRGIYCLNCRKLGASCSPTPYGKAQVKIWCG